MKSIQFNILSIIVLSIFFTSCLPSNPATTLAEWKNSNDTYFTNMKDSTGYVLYTVPAIDGGGSYYYKITTRGDSSSVSPLVSDQVVVDYRGKLVTGSVFDQNYTGAIPPPDSIATPLTTAVNALVIGWQENLVQMKVGEIRSIVLPQELGYGTSGAGNSISPFSTTIWTVKLIKVIHSK